MGDIGKPRRVIEFEEIDEGEWATPEIVPEAPVPQRAPAVPASPPGRREKVPA